VSAPVDPNVPPHSPEAEQGVLGSLLLDQNAMLSVKEMLQPKDFYLDQHARICATIIEMSEQSEPVDLIAVTDRLRDKGQLDHVGGAAYLTSLLNATVAPANIRYHARIVL
jgi:replicative DNA helicase